MDSKLRKATNEEVENVLKNLKKISKKYIKDVYFIMSMQRIFRQKTSFSNFSLSDAVLPTFFVPRSNNNLNETCKLLFAITGDNDPTVWFTSLESDMDELRKCLIHTKLIKWNEVVLFRTIHREHAKLIHEIGQLKNVGIQFDTEASYYTLSKDIAVQFDIE